MWSPLVCPGVFRQGLNCGVFLGSAAGLRAKGGRSLKGACETPAQAEPREGSGDSLEHGGACPVLRELRCPRCVRLNGAKRHTERTLPSGRVGPGPMLRKADGAQVGGTAVREVLGGEDVCRVPGAGEERGGWREGKKVAMWGGAWEDLGVYLRMMGNHGGLLRGAAAFQVSGWRGGEKPGVPGSGQGHARGAGARSWGEPRGHWLLSPAPSLSAFCHPDACERPV